MFHLLFLFPYYVRTVSLAPEIQNQGCAEYAGSSVHLLQLRGSTATA